MASKTIPEVDLSLLITHKIEILKELKHALINYGFFYLKNYDDLLDQNIIELLFEQSAKVFQLPEEEKQKFSLDHSKHFVGYDTTSNEYDLEAAEEMSLCSTNDILNTNSYTYNNVLGPNQYPSQSKVPLFKRSTDQFFEAFSGFACIVTDLILQSLSIDNKEFSKYFDSSNKSSVHSELKIRHQLPPKSKAKSSSQLIESHKEYEFLKFLFHQTPLQAQDLYDTWIDIPPKPNTIVVSSGQLLEFLTNGVCISNNFKVLSTSSESTIVSFSPFLNLDSKLKPLHISEDLLYERDRREKLHSNSNIKSDLKDGDITGEKIFYSKIRNHRKAAQHWYPEILRKQDIQDQYAKLRLKKESTDLEKTVKRLNKIFYALDKSVPLVIRNRTSNANINEVYPKIKSFTGFSVTDDDLLKILYLYRDAVPLILNDYNELMIDTDKAKDAFNYKSLLKRAEAFSSLSSNWLQENKHQDDVPTLSRNDIEKPDEGPIRKRSKIEVLKNSKEKYVIKQKSENVETAKSGMSLLERIRMKEREKMENYKTPEEKYENFLDGKLKAALEILFTLRPDTSYTLEKLSELFQNSFTKSPVSEQEAKDIAVHLTQKFPDIFKSAETKDTTILKWNELDRGELLARLQ